MGAVSLRVLDVDAALEVRALDGREALGETSALELELFSPERVACGDLLGRACAITIAGPGAERTIHGVVMRAAAIATAQSTTGRRYALSVRSSVHRLALRRRTRVFQHLSVPGIARELMAVAGYRQDEIEVRLRRDAIEREYVVQYAETDLGFLRRLCEEDGLSFRFEARDGFDAIVLEDEPGGAEAPLGGPLPVVDAAGLHAARQVAWDFHRVTARRPGRVTLRDHDPNRPALELEAVAEDGLDAERAVEVYRAPARFREPGGGERRARQTLEALRSDALRMRFATNTVLLAPGLSVELEDEHDLDGLRAAGRYAITHVEHRWRAETGQHGLLVTAVPANQRLRLPLVTPRPRIAGLHTAVVTGSAGQDIHTDAAGRVRVRFPWDRDGPADDRSSLPVRALQPSLPGSMLLPRVGWEVLVAFEDGDPDRPYVIGRVFNAKQPPPHSLPANKTITSLATVSSPGGGRRNSVHFDDAAGRQHLAFVAGFGKTLNVGGDMFTQTVGNEVCSIGGSQSAHIGGDDALSVKQPLAVSVASQSATVSGSQALKVLGEMGISAGSESVVIGGALVEKVGNTVDGLKGLGQAAALEVVGSEYGALAGAVAGIAHGAYQGFDRDGAGGAVTGGLQALVGVGAGLVPGGDAVVGALEGTGKAPWDPVVEETASKQTPGGGAAGPSASGKAAVAAGAGHRITKVGGAMSELTGGPHALVTPGNLKWTTLGQSIVVVGGDHTIRAARVSARTLGASSESAASLDVVAGAFIGHNAKGALSRNVAGALHGTGNAAVAITSGGSLSISIGGALTLDGGSNVTFECDGASVSASPGGVLLKASTITINGHVMQKGKATTP